MSYLADSEKRLWELGEAVLWSDGVWSGMVWSDGVWSGMVCNVVEQ